MKPVLRVELSRDADADFVDMLEYGTERFGWAQAEAYAAGFEASFAIPESQSDRIGKSPFFEVNSIRPRNYLLRLSGRRIASCYEAMTLRQIRSRMELIELLSINFQDSST